jgi:hypothetical protein
MTYVTGHLRSCPLTVPRHSPISPTSCAAGPPLDVGERALKGHDQARGARLRGDTRGRDGSVRQELAEKLGAGMTARHRSLAGSGEAFEVWFDL